MYMYMYMYLCVYIHMCVGVCVYIYTCMCVCVYACVYIYIIYKYIYSILFTQAGKAHRQNAHVISRDLCRSSIVRHIDSTLFCQDSQDTLKLSSPSLSPTPTHTSREPPPSLDHTHILKRERDVNVQRVCVFVCAMYV